MDLGGDIAPGPGGSSLAPRTQPPSPAAAVAAMADMAWGVGEAAEQSRDAERDKERFKAMLRFWKKHCLVCFMTYPASYQTHWYCSGAKAHAVAGQLVDPTETWEPMIDAAGVWDTVRAKVKEIYTIVRGKGWQHHTRETQGRLAARGFARFSGCHYCGVPQGLCGRWRAQADDGGSYDVVPHLTCSYPDVMARCLGYALGAGLLADKVRAEAVRIIRQCGVWVADDIPLPELMLLRVRWAGVEANGLCILFFLSHGIGPDGTQTFYGVPVRVDPLRVQPLG